MTITSFPIIPFYDSAGCRYDAFTDGHAVGFTVTFPDDSITHLYLNPSLDSDDDDLPCVFIYEGPEGDPNQDAALHFYELERPKRVTGPIMAGQ